MYNASWLWKAKSLTHLNFILHGVMDPLFMVVVQDTVKPVLRDNCHERAYLEGPHTPGRRSHISMQLNLSTKTTCLERLYFMANGAVFQDRFYCIYGYCTALIAG